MTSADSQDFGAYQMTDTIEEGTANIGLSTEEHNTELQNSKFMPPPLPPRTYSNSDLFAITHTHLRTSTVHRDTVKPTPDTKTVTRDNGSNYTVIGKEDTIQISEKLFQESQDMIKNLEDRLVAETKLRTKAQNDLKSVSRQWKQVAHELSKQQTSAKSFHTVTDEYLKQQVGQLNYDIRTLAETYFDDLPPSLWPQASRQTDSPRPILPRHYDDCPASPTLAKSFVWRVLCKYIFNYFAWPTTTRVGEGLYDLTDHLEPTITADEFNDSSKLEALKKYHIWRATTADMVFKTDATMKTQDARRSYIDSVIKKHIDPITLRFIREPQRGQYHDLLHQIVENAVNLDEEISRQPAMVSWVFEAPESGPDSEGLDDTCLHYAVSGNQGVPVIIAPALMKRGKSSGEDFHEETQLLAAEICIVQDLLQS
ncbi:putative PH domain-containing protein [Seiridium unicorne]|uniref:PH domain-containing protein n=1 Tax=Seiridium unicorne TaxID=138068 RepID=A0ABR2UDZ8_9PEZI